MYRFNGEELNLTEKEWKERLSPEQFRILRKNKSEPAFHNEYYDWTEPGIYHCAGCNLPLFCSDSKYDSKAGWPTFSQPICSENVFLERTWNPFSKKREVLCSRCEGHLGYIFSDSSSPTGKRYRINSAALKFVEQ